MYSQNVRVNNTPYQYRLPLDITLKFDDVIQPNDIVMTVVKAVRESDIIRYVKTDQRDAHGHDSMNMLTAVMLAFTLFGYTSLRQLQDYCANDARFLLVTGGMKPSFMSFERFIHDDLTDSIEDIFCQLNKYIEKEDGRMNTKVLYVDGTKYEAYAKKTSFVWINGTKRQRAKLWGRIMDHLMKLNKRLQKEKILYQFSILHEMSFEYIIKVCNELEKIMNDRNIKVVHGKGSRKHWLQKEREYFRDSAIRMWKYQLHLDIAGNRNSFSKTDPDATFMHMKYDYYNHTNVFKPGYNVQMGISDGYIRAVYVSADPNDMKAYIPFMDKYHRMYDEYPEKTPADAGYGSYDNYYYCRQNHIQLFLKYPAQEKQKEKITDKNRFKSWAFKRDENGAPICPAGHTFELESTRVEQRGLYPRTTRQYTNSHCANCPFHDKCTKSKGGRKITLSPLLEEFQAEVRENMNTDEGKELMLNRDIWSEGTFGGLKEDWEYERLHRRGYSNVNTEILLVCAGHNLRRLLVRKQEQAKESGKLN